MPRSEILSRSTTVTTRVRFTLDDGTELELDVAHFEPADEAAILAGIDNRAASEQRKHDEGSLD